MRTKVYTFKPKRKGYTIYATKTYHGRRSWSSSNRSRHSGGSTKTAATGLVDFIVRSIFNLKK